jgi:hypothetical protein
MEERDGGGLRAEGEIMDKWRKEELYPGPILTSNSQQHIISNACPSAGHHIVLYLHLILVTSPAEHSKANA